jgi:hypothetical protein
MLITSVVPAGVLPPAASHHVQPLPVWIERAGVLLLAGLAEHRGLPDLARSREVARDPAEGQLRRRGLPHDSGWWNDITSIASSLAGAPVSTQFPWSSS